MCNAIVTGANGFIGINLCKVLNDRGVRTYAVLRKETSYYDELYTLKNTIPIICDLNKSDNLIDLIPEPAIDVIYHLAWDGVSGNERGDYQVQLNNIKCTLSLLSAVNKLGCKRFVGVGSAAEFNSYNTCSADGRCPDDVGIYGISKMTAHYMSKIVCNTYGMEHIWGIVGNTYGAGDNSNNFINFAMQLIMSSEDANFTSGYQNCDFVYVTDVVNALYCLGTNGRDKCSYYIGSGSPRKLREYIIQIRNIVNPGKKLHLGAVSYNGVSASIESFSIEKLKRDTGFIPEVDFSEGIRKAVEWIKEEK